MDCKDVTGVVGKALGHSVVCLVVICVAAHEGSSASVRNRPRCFVSPVVSEDLDGHIDASWVDNLGLAIGTLKTGRTVAGVAIDTVVTSTTVQTRIRRTIIDVDLAAISRVPVKAGTSEAVDSIGTAAAVQTRIGRTFIDVGLAIATSEARLTRAGVGIDAVGANAIVLTGVGRTIVGIDLTGGPFEAGADAVAGKSVDSIDADAAVLAARRSTIV